MSVDLKQFQTVKSGLRFPKGVNKLTGIIKSDAHTAPFGDDQD